MKTIYYVYEWFRSDYNVVFYVGKGKNKRAWDFKRKQQHLINVLKELEEKKIKPQVRIIARFLSNDAALQFERERIAFWWYLKEHGLFVNKTIGGQGSEGWHPTEEQIKKNVDSWTDEKRAYFSALKSGSGNPMFGRKGEKHPNYKKPKTQKQIESARVSIKKNSKINDPDWKKMMSKIMSGENNSSKKIENIIKMRETKNTPEAKARASASQKARREREKAEREKNAVFGN